MPPKRPKLVTITPEMAAAAVATTRQRTIKDHKIEQYTQAMLEGEWHPKRHKEKPVTFRDHRLSNGNHRMHAIIAAGIPVQCYVRVEPDTLAEWVDNCVVAGSGE